MVRKKEKLTTNKSNNGAETGKKHKRLKILAKFKKKAGGGETSLPKKQKKVESPPPKSASISTLACLPSQQKCTRISSYIGFFSRALTAAVAVFGLSLFICDAFSIVTERVPFTAVLYPSIIFSVIISAMCLDYYALVVGIVLIGGGFTVWASMKSLDIIDYIVSSITSFYNAAIDRIAFAGLVGIKRYALPENVNAYDKTSLFVMGVAIFTLIIALLFVPAIIKRVRMKYIIIMGALFVTPVLTYNIMRDNWGFSVLLAGFSGVIVLWLYDRRYIMPSKRKMIIYDLSELSPAIADSLSENGAGPADEDADNKTGEKKKKARKTFFALFRRPRGKDTDIESALTLQSPRDRRRRIREQRTVKRAQRAEAKRLRKKEKREAKKQSRLTDDVLFANTALGGFAGLLASGVVFLLVLVPTLVISRAYGKIDIISDLVETARIYVTAFITGEDVDLNNVSIFGEKGENAGPRSVALDYPEFKGEKVALVETPYNTPVYLRTWIGTRYEDDHWYSATLEEIDDYKDKFGKYFAPESITENFYEAIDPSYDEYSMYSGYKDNISNGFIIEHVNLTKLKGRSLLLYIPSFIKPSAGLLRYHTTEPAYLQNEPYFDGVWISKFFIKGSRYATISLVTTMRDKNLWRNMNNNLTYYNEMMSIITSPKLKELEKMSKEERENYYKLLELWLACGFCKERGYDTGEANYLFGIHTEDNHKGFFTTKDIDYLIGNPDLLKEYYASRLEDPNIAIKYEGELLVKRFVEDMTDKERYALIEAYNKEEKYREYVKNTYTQIDENDEKFLKNFTKEVLRNYLSSNDDSAVSYDYVINYDKTNLQFTYRDYHRATLALIDYLNKNYTYSQTPPEDETGTSTDTSAADSGDDSAVTDSAETDSIETDIAETDSVETCSDENENAETDNADTIDEANLTAIQDFLVKSKRGYCVQFASALTLMLRSVGIPARYCEGFIASEFTNTFFTNDDPLTRYKCDVKDSNAHAWVEVYYDNIGWVQYEATPPYLAGMYGDGSSDSEIPSKDIDIVDPGLKTPEDIDGPEVEKGGIISDTALMIIISACIVIAVALVITAIVIVIIKKTIAEKIVVARENLIRRSMDLSVAMTDYEMRSGAREMCYGIFALFKALGEEPAKGELSDGYARRLDDTFGSVSLIKPREMLDYVQKEEFGDGLTRRELSLLAEYYRDLTTNIYSGLGRFNKFRFRYIKNLL